MRILINNMINKVVFFAVGNKYAVNGYNNLVICQYILLR